MVKCELLAQPSALAFLWLPGATWLLFFSKPKFFGVVWFVIVCRLVSMEPDSLTPLLWETDLGRMGFRIPAFFLDGLVPK